MNLEAEAEELDDAVAHLDAKGEAANKMLHRLRLGKLQVRLADLFLHRARVRALLGLELSAADQSLLTAAAKKEAAGG